MHPVSLRRCKLPDDSWGDTSIGKRDGKPVIVVRVSTELPHEAQLFVLVHELAHALQWRPDAAEETRENDHDAEWGVAYARIWRELIG